MSNLQTVREMIKPLAKPEPIDFPLDCENTADTESRSIAIDANRNRYKECLENDKLSRKRMMELEAEYASIVRVTEVKSVKESMIEIQSTRLQIISTSESDYLGDKNLINTKKKLDKMIQNKEYLTTAARFESDSIKLQEMKDNETAELASQIRGIDEGLYVEYSEVEINDLIHEHTESAKDFERISSLDSKLNTYPTKPDLDSEKSQLSELRTVLEKHKYSRQIHLSQKDPLTCPSCDSLLRLVDKTLVLQDDLPNVDAGDSTLAEVEDLIAKSQTNVSMKLQRIYELERNIQEETRDRAERDTISNQYEEPHDLLTAKEDLTELREYKQTQRENVATRSRLVLKLENKSYSKSLGVFIDDLKCIESRLGTLRLDGDYIDSEESEAILRDLVASQQHIKDTIVKSNREKDQLEKQITMYRDDIRRSNSDHKASYKQLRDESIVREAIAALETDIQSNAQNMNIEEASIAKVELFKIYEDQRKKYEDQEKDLSLLEGKIVAADQLYTASLKFKALILKSEGVAMRATLEDLNNHAQLFLEDFFENDPITVVLSSFKDIKSTHEIKPVINVKIEYKGVECDIHCLSGGEMARVTLAYTLALSELYGSSLLLLDECTASLDQETTTTVFNSIKKRLPNKKVIVIAHQIVTGCFDDVVHLY